jgi:hypothetical protein
LRAIAMVTHNEVPQLATFTLGHGRQLPSDDCHELNSAQARSAAGSPCSATAA